jgi:hypothetical protein
MEVLQFTALTLLLVLLFFLYWDPIFRWSPKTSLLPRPFFWLTFSAVAGLAMLSTFFQANSSMFWGIQLLIWFSVMWERNFLKRRLIKSLLEEYSSMEREEAASSPRSPA